MSKKLTALEALHLLYTHNKLKNRDVVAYLLEKDYLPKYYDIVENELKRLEKIDNILPLEIRDVDDLERLINRSIDDQKKIKALEIIKEKGIILQFIKETYTVEQYNAGVYGTLVKPLTQEEYELLKEVLLC